VQVDADAIGAGKYELLSVPVPSNYIQSIRLDPVRRLIYGFTYPSEQMFRYDIETGTTSHIAFIGNGIMICDHPFVELLKPGRARVGSGPAQSWRVEASSHLGSGSREQFVVAGEVLDHGPRAHIVARPPVGISDPGVW
jgi:hypothetical protein